MYGVIRYEIYFPSIKFHLIKLHNRYMVTAAKAPTSVSFSRFRSPEETVAYMNAFNDAMPAIYRYIEEEIAALARNELLASITTSTAKGMIEQIINEEGLDVPKISSIRGTDGKSGKTCNGKYHRHKEGYVLFEIVFHCFCLLFCFFYKRTGSGINALTQLVPRDNVGLIIIQSEIAQSQNILCVCINHENCWCFITIHH
jgi:hypothetical protein